jgi:hypothetical protein
MLRRENPRILGLLIDEIQLLFSISIRADTHRHVCRTLPGVKTVDGIPVDKARVTCDEGKVADFYTYLGAMIEDVPAEFIWNVDEAFGAAGLRGIPLPGLGKHSLHSM